MKKKGLCVMCREVSVSTSFIYMITKDAELLASGSNYHGSVSQRRCNFGCNHCRSLMEWNPSSGDLV